MVSGMVDRFWWIFSLFLDLKRPERLLEAFVTTTITTGKAYQDVGVRQLTLECRRRNTMLSF